MRSQLYAAFGSCTRSCCNQIALRRGGRFWSCNGQTSYERDSAALRASPCFQWLRCGNSVPATPLRYLTFPRYSRDLQSLQPPRAFGPFEPGIVLSKTTRTSSFSFHASIGKMATRPFPSPLKPSRFLYS